MINDLKRMNVFLLLAVLLLLALNVSLIRDLSEMTDRAEKLSSQVYSLGSMLGERNAANNAQMTISEVSNID